MIRFAKVVLPEPEPPAIPITRHLCFCSCFFSLGVMNSLSLKKRGVKRCDGCLVMAAAITAVMLMRTFGRRSFFFQARYFIRYFYNLSCFRVVYVFSGFFICVILFVILFVFHVSVSVCKKKGKRFKTGCFPFYILFSLSSNLGAPAGNRTWITSFAGWDSIR